MCLSTATNNHLDSRMESSLLHREHTKKYKSLIMAKKDSIQTFLINALK